MADKIAKLRPPFPGRPLGTMPIRSFATSADDPQESVVGNRITKQGVRINKAATVPLSPRDEAPGFPPPESSDAVSVDQNSVQAVIFEIEDQGEEEDSSLSKSKKIKTEDSTPPEEIQRAEEAGTSSEKVKDGSPPSKKGGDSAGEDGGDPTPFEPSEIPDAGSFDDFF
jgi:hypothetical protein